jgi:uncharacterized protein
MQIDISDLIGKRLTQQEVNVSFEGKSFTLEGEEIGFIDPILVEGVFTMLGDIISFNGKIKTTLRLVCSRCLENFNYGLEMDIDEKFSKVIHDEDNDIIIINSDRVDFSPIIETNLILSLPMKKLCEEECKGLCSVCGTNLNYSNCNCEKNDIDPRLAKLREFFSTN